MQLGLAKCRERYKSVNLPVGQLLVRTKSRQLSEGLQPSYRTSDCYAHAEIVAALNG